MTVPFRGSLITSRAMHVLTYIQSQREPRCLVGYFGESIIDYPGELRSSWVLFSE
jgi:hypothetical protein